MKPLSSTLARAQAFCEAYQLQLPILMAPMAGACPPSLASAVANAGGMGGCGVLLMQPDKIAEWAAAVRANSNGGFQLNSWIPDPTPTRDAEQEAQIRAFLADWGPDVDETAADVASINFELQCEAMLAAGPAVISSIMGLYPAPFVARLRAANIRWFATVTTVTEARAAQAAGADVIVAQGMEAGGHRGAFDAAKAGAELVGLFSLVPAVVDAVSVPVVATGGIADARGVAAALMLGASAVQIGTGLLRTPEAGIAPAWANAIASAMPEATTPTRAFSGRLGRSINTAYVTAAAGPEAPDPAPYPIQRNLTAAMRVAGTQADDINRIQAWAGQSSALASAAPAAEVVSELWAGAKTLLGADA